MSNTYTHTHDMRHEKCTLKYGIKNIKKKYVKENLDSELYNVVDFNDTM